MCKTEDAQYGGWTSALVQVIWLDTNLGRTSHPFVCMLCSVYYCKDHVAAIWTVCSWYEKFLSSTKQRKKYCFLVLHKLKPEILKHQALNYIHFTSHSMSCWTTDICEGNKEVFYFLKELKNMWLHNGLQNVF